MIFTSYNVIMRTIERDIVSAVIVSGDGKIFEALQTPGGGGVYEGCWCIPGGGIDDGEDQRTALNREMMEETGIDISKYPVELVQTDEGDAEKTLKKTGERILVKMKFHTYRVVINDKRADEIKITLNDELSEYKWCDTSEIKNLKLSPPSIVLFNKLGYL
jgi:8-oxo-dGTP pyrophosphatase MutT (NUDIX family)